MYGVCPAVASRNSGANADSAADLHDMFLWNRMFFNETDRSGGAVGRRAKKIGERDLPSG
jgi:hypothetical protein